MIQAILVLNFKKIFAMHMVSAIKEVIRHKCEGCQLEFPSQLDHKCLGGKCTDIFEHLRG